VIPLGGCFIGLEIRQDSGPQTVVMSKSGEFEEELYTGRT